MPQWPEIFAALREQGIGVTDTHMPRPVSGGDVSATWQLQSADGPLFVKTGSAQDYEMLRGEADGLAALQKAAALRAPTPLAICRVGEQSVLAIEWLDLQPGSAKAERALGSKLAALHRVTAPRFGWHRDNTIGKTPQHNRWHEDWIRFFIEQRLEYQFRLAAQNGFDGELQNDGKRLMDDAAKFFTDYWPEPSLLHGDLWGGNWAVCEGSPVIFDPAVYYGDRESDLAMTRLFGGFGAPFYDAYEEAWPLAPGAGRRMELYSLYHVLNHLNLYGSAYLGRARNLVQALL
jgi:fructosamine-3-kinase